MEKPLKYKDGVDYEKTLGALETGDYVIVPTSSQDISAIRTAVCKAAKKIEKKGREVLVEDQGVADKQIKEHSAQKIPIKDFHFFQEKSIRFWCDLREGKIGSLVCFRRSCHKKPGDEKEKLDPDVSIFKLTEIQSIS